MQPGQKRSGLYHIRLPGARSSFWQLLVYCDQETTGGGWMVKYRTKIIHAFLYILIAGKFFMKINVNYELNIIYHTTLFLQVICGEGSSRMSGVEWKLKL